MRVGGGGYDIITALSADSLRLWLYIFVVEPAMRQNLCFKHNVSVATSVYVATGKQETVKEAQVCIESMKT